MGSGVGRGEEEEEEGGAGRVGHVGAGGRLASAPGCWLLPTQVLCISTS